MKFLIFLPILLCLSLLQNISAQTGPTLFYLSEDTVCVDEPIFISQVINDAASYQWSFGDGSSSGLQKPPTKKYSNLGQYTVNLTVNTKPGQYLIDNLRLLSHQSYFSLTDPVPDVYCIVKNSQGATIYQSGTYFDVNGSDLPLNIPVALLVEPGFYILEFWDYDLLDADDFLGEVYLLTPTQAGTYSTGPVSVIINPVPAASQYTFSRAVVVLKPYITAANGILTANLEADPAGPDPLYQWYSVDSMEVSLATGMQFVPQAPGCYVVRITNSFYCDDFSEPYCFNVTSVESPQEQALQIWPQPLPSGTPLQLRQSEGAQGLSRISVFKTTGTLCERFEGPFNSAAFSLHFAATYPAGVYFLHVEYADGRQQTHRLLIQG